ncbi:MAG: monovalent cation/H(+) antiporter subunit G [Bacteroidetes bacterium]|nr:monovalent cation/H(+) antiporter subunit G [Bacteroidota bacterium]MCW5897035.1 monovalent cation/H(+) antiporter subunit G [Bacteroidota bacterium]
MGMTEIIAVLMILGGGFFLLVASIGIVRFPDFYTRLHAMGKGDTLGIILILLGLCVYEGFTLNSAKLLIALVFVGLTNPVATHALARAALRYGLKPLLKLDQKDMEPSTTSKIDALET